MNKVYFSHGTNVFFNIAYEDYLFRTAKPDERILYLWKNESTVIIGRTQNAWKECNVEKLTADGVCLARRETGGGAVFQDVHNLCFTIICANGSFDKEKNTAFICDVLRSFKIDAVPNGRNDIEVNGYKVSGSAFRFGKDVSLHHGTLLVNTDLNRLTKYLTPSIKKMQAKGVSSVRSRVENLSTFCDDLSVEVLERRLRDTFCALYNASAVEYGVEITRGDSMLQEEYAKLQSWAWCYGSSPHFTHIIENRFEWGNAEILLDVQNGIIRDVTVYCDALDITIPERIKALLIGMDYDEVRATSTIVRAFSL